MDDTDTNNIAEYKNQLEFIIKNISEEVKYYNKSFEVDEDLIDDDMYNKFVLFTLYRAIERLVDLIFDIKIRSCNNESSEKGFLNCLIAKIKSNYIDFPVIKYFMDGIVCGSSITNGDIYEVISSIELTEIKIKKDYSSVFKSDARECEFPIKKLDTIYGAVRKNRNQLMHGLNGDLKVSTVREAMMLFAYFYKSVDIYIKDNC